MNAECLFGCWPRYCSQDGTYSMSQSFGTPQWTPRASLPICPRPPHPSPAVLSEAHPSPLQLRASSRQPDGQLHTDSAFLAPRPAASRWPALGMAPPNRARPSRSCLEPSGSIPLPDRLLWNAVPSPVSTWHPGGWQTQGLKNEPIPDATGEKHLGEQLVGLQLVDPTRVPSRGAGGLSLHLAAYNLQKSDTQNLAAGVSSRAHASACVPPTWRVLACLGQVRGTSWRDRRVLGTVLSRACHSSEQLTCPWLG